MTLRNFFFYIIGIGFLFLAKVKNMLQGYSSPKSFDISETERCIEYDIRTVEHWLYHLQKYTQGTYSIAGKNILELGPGSDLGVGIYLISKGCYQYNAVDVNDLMKSVPETFYKRLFERLKSINAQTDINFLKNQLKAVTAGNSSQLNYVVRNDFDLVSSIGKSKIDLVFSQAAFEHFNDIEETISQLSEVCKPGTILIIEIDLQTHSRWIRDEDPNNIYRYSNSLYSVFWFSGIPNRVRPIQYKKAFEYHGWTDIQITPLSKLDNHDKSYSGINKTFVHSENQMDYLSIILCARKIL